MCGFTITKEKIPNLIKHRGLKEENVVFDDWNINFNSLPLSSKGTNINQPIKTKSGYFVFNGEIFNYSSLRGKFKSDLHYLEYLFRNDDIISVYEESLKWDGFWSIAYVSYNNVYFFTDWLGKKQLYYSSNGISSEIKPFLDSNVIRVYDKRTFGTLNTPFQGINRAMPGSLNCDVPADVWSHAERRLRVRPRPGEQKRQVRSDRCHTAQDCVCGSDIHAHREVDGQHKAEHQL